MVIVQPGAEDDLDNLNKELADNWEPYAVTWDGHQFDHHLRRRTSE